MDRAARTAGQSVQDPVASSGALFEGALFAKF